MSVYSDKRRRRLASPFGGGGPAKPGRRGCRFDVRTLPQSALWAASPLKEGAKASTLLLCYMIIYRIKQEPPGGFLRAVWF